MHVTGRETFRKWKARDRSAYGRELATVSAGKSVKLKKLPTSAPGEENRAAAYITYFSPEHDELLICVWHLAEDLYARAV